MVDTTQEQLLKIQKSRTHDAPVLADLRKRKLVTMVKVISYKIAKGAKYAREIPKEETDLTHEMLAKYVNAPLIPPGYLLILLGQRFLEELEFQALQLQGSWRAYSMRCFTSM